MSKLHAEILDAPTPQEVRARHLEDEFAITDLVRYTAGNAVGVIKRFDYWSGPDGGDYLRLRCGNRLKSKQCRLS